MKIIIIASFFTAFSWGAAAQNRSINFEETKVWQEIVQTAKKEKKLIFVDCYTDWCGPCKKLAAEVFTQDEVADFFNANFINAKFEMEKDADGIAHRDAWAAGAYPTFLFIDPQSEVMVHRAVGAGTADWLIGEAKTALDPAKSFSNIDVRYENGERSPEFIMEYLKSLGALNMRDKREAVAAEFLKNYSLEQLATQENWEIIQRNMSDPLSLPLRTIMANRQSFYDIEGVGKQRVDNYLMLSIDDAVGRLARDPGFDAKDQTRLEELLKYLSEVDFPAKTSSVIWLESTEMMHEKNWKGLKNKIVDVEKSGAMSPKAFIGYYNFFIESFGGSADNGFIDWAAYNINMKLDMLDEESIDSEHNRGRLIFSKSRLFRRAGFPLIADRLESQSDIYLKR